MTLQPNDELLLIEEPFGRTIHLNKRDTRFYVDNIEHGFMNLRAARDKCEDLGKKKRPKKRANLDTKVLVFTGTGVTQYTLIRVHGKADYSNSVRLTVRNHKGKGENLGTRSYELTHIALADHLSEDERMACNLYAEIRELKALVSDKLSTAKGFLENSRLPRFLANGRVTCIEDAQDLDERLAKWIEEKQQAVDTANN